MHVKNREVNPWQTKQFLIVVKQIYVQDCMNSPNIGAGKDEYASRYVTHKNQSGHESCKAN